MPKVGTPASNSDGSTLGAPSAYTDDGPPERMMRERPAGQHLLDRHRVRDDLAVHARLPHPAGDQLGVLRAEVDDEDRPIQRRGHERATTSAFWKSFSDS